jgi:hypothetical protein
MNRIFVYIMLFIFCSITMIILSQFIYFGVPFGDLYSDWKWWVYLVMMTFGIVGVIEGGRFYQLWVLKYKNEKDKEKK